MTNLRASGSDLTALVEQARQAQPAWAALSVRRRLEPVEAFRRLLVSDCSALRAVLGEELGKTPAEAIGAEVLPTADACRFLLRQAGRLLRPRRVSLWQRPLWLSRESDTVHRRPRGVVGIIGTWNYPLFLNGVQILQALTAGNAVVWKPSELTPRFAELLQGWLDRAGFSPGLVQVLPAAREMGPALAEAAIDHVVFTGSASVGRKLAARLGERLVSSTLELSGCDAQFVLADGNVALAARAAWFGCTVNRGQTCIAVRRAFVHRSLYSAFCDALQGLAKQAPALSLRTPGQGREADRLLADAVAGGGRVLGGGPASADGACRPAVVVDAKPDMALCREAAFAPLMAVLPFDTPEEALLLDQACPYALGASVFAGDVAQAEWLAARLRAGMVTINDVIVPTAHPATPFGGRGDSGWGVTQGAEGLLAMTVPQTVSVRGGTFRPHYDSGTASKEAALEEFLRAMLEATHGAGIGRRMRGWWRVARAMWRGL